MIRNEHYRYDLLRKGIKYGELFSIGSGPTLRCDSSGNIKASMQGVFSPEAIGQTGKPVEVDWMFDEIRVMYVLDGKEYAIATLIPTSTTPKESNGQKTIDLQAYDRCWAVRDVKLEARKYIAAGSLYTTVIENLLVECGIPVIIKTASDATFQTDRDDWDFGTSYLDIINTLLKEINYKSLWFDSVGNARIEPIIVPTSDSIQHVFTDKKVDPRNLKEVGIVNMYPSITRQTDIYNVPNVIVCICSNADMDSPMVAKAENTNPNSPVSIPRRGRRIVRVEKVDNIASLDELKRYADQLLSKSMTTEEKITIVTPNLPGFGTSDISAIRYGDDIFSLCTETAWSMELKPGGNMTHTLEKVVVPLELD